MYDRKKLNDMVKKSGADSETAKKINDFLKNMSDEDMKKLNAVLSDKEASKRILASEKAQEIIKKISKNGGKM